MDLLQTEEERCRRCRAGERVACDGWRREVNREATDLYGQAVFVQVPCPRYAELERAGRLRAGVRLSGLPPAWEPSSQPRLHPRLPDGPLPACLVVYPEQPDDNGAQITVTKIVQSAVYRALREDMPAHYVWGPLVRFENLDATCERLADAPLVAIDRWDVCVQHPNLLGQLAAAIESRIVMGRLTVVGLLQPLRRLRAMVPEQSPVIGRLKAGEQLAVGR